jgi:hypothetical protein
MSKPACPFEEGDRVDHKVFGFGTVSGAPVAVVGPGGRQSMEVVDKGWTVPVAWDDRARTADRVAHWALTKVSSPDARPFTYWDRQWQPLLKTWIAARRLVEEASGSFRPLPDPERLQQLQAAETAAHAAIQAFIEAERAGRHG